MASRKLIPLLDGDENFRLHVLFSMRSTFKGEKKKRRTKVILPVRKLKFLTGIISLISVWLFWLLWERRVFTVMIKLSILEVSFLLVINRNLSP